MEIIIKKSRNPKKKYDAVFNGEKTLSFGAAGYSDYTIHKDDKRKDLYLRRHSNEDWSRSNIASPAWLSRWILWEKKTSPEAIKHVNTMYKNVYFKML